MKQILTIVVFLFLITGLACSEQTLDTSSDEAMKLSIEKMKKNLPKEKQEELNSALKIILLNKFDVKNVFKKSLSGEKIEIEKPDFSEMEGYNANKIIAIANKIAMEKKQKEKANIIEEISKLENKKKKSEQRKDKIKDFKVISAILTYERVLNTRQPIILLFVKNDTNYSISRAYFKGTITSPGRPVPWINEDFNYSIPGGVEPGEVVKWRLAPNMFSPWGQVDVPEGYVFDVQVKRLDGPNGEQLFKDEFTEDDQYRLDELKQKQDSLTLVE